MSDMPVPVAIPIANVPSVDVDMPCIGCAYNLRSMPLGSRCPECGRGIIDSIRHGWLIFADATWLRRVRNGVDLALWSFLGAGVGYAIMGVTFAFALPNFSNSPDFPALRIVMLVLSIGWLAAWLMAVWYLTSPEPVNDKSVVNLRTPLVRWCIGLNSMPLLSSLASAGGSEFSATIRPGAFAIALVTVAALVSMAAFVGYLLLLIHLRRIARRDTRKGVAKLITFMLWGMCIVGVFWGFGTVAILGIAFASSNVHVTNVSPSGTVTTYSYSTTMPSVIVASQPAASPVVTSPSKHQSVVELSSPESEDDGTKNDVGTNTSTATSMPTTNPALLAPPGPRLAFFFPIMIGVFLAYLFAIAWGICGIVMTFLYRGMLTRAIRENRSDIWRRVESLPGTIV